MKGGEKPLEREYGKLAIKYNNLKEELFKSALCHSNNRELLNLINDTGLYMEFIGYCSVRNKKSAEEVAFQQRK